LSPHFFKICWGQIFRYYQLEKEKGDFARKAALMHISFH
jgi:hypothetical protein